MNKKEVKSLIIIDTITRSMYDVAKGLMPSIAMIILFKSPLGVMNLGQKLICIAVAMSGVCVEYLKLNKYIRIIMKREHDEKRYKEVIEK